MAFGDFTVVRSTVKYVLNSSGVLASVAVNTPAFEFNTDGSYKGLLVEPAGTNLALRSEEIDNASWTKQGLGVASAPVVTANTSVAPDGTTTAETVVLELNGGTLTGDVSWLFQNRVLSATTTHTFSYYVKASAPSEVGKQFRTGFVGYTPVVTLTADWQRVSITQTTTTAGTYSIGARLRGIEITPTVSFLIWGAQLETGSVATSYIPTVASTVTRTADSISLTGASSLIGQTEGTMYAEVDISNLIIGAIFTIDDGDATDFISLSRLANLTIRASIRRASGAIVSIITSSAVSVGMHKIALGYKNGDYALYIDGVQAGTSTNATNYPATTLTQVLISGSNYGPVNDRYRSVALFPTRLTNAQLATLTTL